MISTRKLNRKIFKNEKLINLSINKTLDYHCQKFYPCYSDYFKLEFEKYAYQIFSALAG